MHFSSSKFTKTRFGSVRPGPYWGAAYEAHQTQYSAGGHASPASSTPSMSRFAPRLFWGLGVVECVESTMINPALAKQYR